jgi:hypothetical protein
MADWNYNNDIRRYSYKVGRYQSSWRNDPGWVKLQRSFESSARREGGAATESKKISLK